VTGVLVAQLVFQDLAADGLREGVGEDDVLGCLVPGQSLPTERDDFRRAGLAACPADDDRGDRLAPAVVRQPDDDGLVNVRVLGEPSSVAD
jgi:hypothetical protein